MHISPADIIVPAIVLLRDLVFRDPALFVGRLWAKDRVGFVSGLWEEVGRKLAQHGAPAGLTPAGMAVDCLHLPDGRGIAVVKLPESKRSSEFFLIGSPKISGALSC